MMVDLRVTVGLGGCRHRDMGEKPTVWLADPFQNITNLVSIMETAVEMLQAEGRRALDLHEAT